MDPGSNFGFVPMYYEYKDNIGSINTVIY